MSTLLTWKLSIEGNEFYMSLATGMQRMLNEDEYFFLFFLIDIVHWQQSEQVSVLHPQRIYFFIFGLFAYWTIKASLSAHGTSFYKVEKNGSV